MNTIHLFAGAGGSLLVGDVLGWTHTAAAEFDPWCRATLALRWPQIKDNIHERVETTDWQPYAGNTDLVAAGWPCQPVSIAGKRRGFTDPRDGWPHLCAAVSVIRPRLLFLENSPDVLTANGGAYWGVCLAALGAMGFDARWVCVRADEAGAPQERNRLWCIAWQTVADATSERRQRRQDEQTEGRDTTKRRQEIDIASDSSGGHAEPEVGRSVDGLADRLPWPAYSNKWPSFDGIAQAPWEPPRTCGKLDGRAHQLRALGNGWVPAQALLAWRLLTQ